MSRLMLLLLLGLLALPARADERLVWAGPRVLGSTEVGTLHAVLPRPGQPIQATLRCEGQELGLGQPIYGSPPGTHWAFRVPIQPGGGSGCTLSVFCSDGRSYQHAGPISLVAAPPKVELRPSSNQLISSARGRLPVALRGLAGKLRARLLNLDRPEASIFWSVKLPPREGQRLLNLALPRQAPAPGTYLLVLEQDDGVGALAPQPLTCTALEELKLP